VRTSGTGFIANAIPLILDYKLGQAHGLDGTEYEIEVKGARD
jgi:hypothetical protein